MILPIDVITWNGRYPEFENDKHIKNNPEYIKNIEELCRRVNTLLLDFKKDYPDFKAVITSGYRPIEYEWKKARSGRSNHCKGAAIDIWDPKKILGEWCARDSGAIMVKYDLYMEALSTTHKSMAQEDRWCHLQIFPPKSGKRIYIP